MFFICGFFPGTFAINSLMLHSTITGAGGVERRALSSTQNTSDVTTGTDYGWPPTNIEISTTLAMTCGLFQVKYCSVVKNLKVRYSF